MYTIHHGTVDGKTLVCTSWDLWIQRELWFVTPVPLWSPRAVRYVTHCAVAVNGNTQVLLAMSKLDGVPLDQWLLGSYQNQGICWFIGWGVPRVCWVFFWKDNRRPMLNTQTAPSRLQRTFLTLKDLTWPERHEVQTWKGFPTCYCCYWQVELESLNILSGSLDLEDCIFLQHLLLMIRHDLSGTVLVPYGFFQQLRETLPVTSSATPLVRLYGINEHELKVISRWPQVSPCCAPGRFQEHPYLFQLDLLMCLCLSISTYWPS